MILMNDFKASYPKYKTKLMRAVENVFESGWYVMGEHVTQFESKFAEFCATNHCVGTANGLEAIQIALMAVGVGDGDEVITTPLTAFATTSAIINCGARPVFADVDSLTLNMNTTLVEQLISPKTKAVLPVHLYGNPANLDHLVELCQKHNLHLIEDACQAHGALFRGKPVGSFGTIGCFSFYPTKNLGGYGDGGALVCNEEKFAVKAKAYSDYGQVSKYKHDIVGLNSRLDELQAALLLVKLNMLGEEVEKRQSIASRYLKYIDNTSVTCLATTLGGKSSFHLFVLRTQYRDKLKGFLTENKIMSHIHYPIAVHKQNAIRSLPTESPEITLPVCEQAVKEVISIPIHPELSSDQVEYIIETINRFNP